MPHYDYGDASQWRGTTILSVRKNGKVVVVGDGSQCWQYGYESGRP